MEENFPVPWTLAAATSEKPPATDSTRLAVRDAEVTPQGNASSAKPMRSSEEWANDMPLTSYGRIVEMVEAIQADAVRSNRVVREDLVSGLIERLRDALQRSTENGQRFIQKCDPTADVDNFNWIMKAKLVLNEADTYLDGNQ